MKRFLFLVVFFSSVKGFSSIKDSINYHEIKDAVACFDCINRNREMLWQVIVHLERLDSNKVTIFSRGSYYFDLSMAYAILTELGENYFQIAKRFAAKAIHYAGYPSHFLHMATLYQREGRCDSMEVCLTPHIEALTKSVPSQLAQIDQLRKSCIPISK